MKILLYTDLIIRPDQLFWHRDLGLLTQAFRDLGHTASLVLHPATEPHPHQAHPLDQLSATINSPESTATGASAPLPKFAPSRLHPSATSKILGDPILWVSHSQVRDKQWWQSHQPDLIILGLWTRPKYDSIRLAALSATPRVIERADSDGLRTASCGLTTYARRRFDYFRDRTSRLPSLLSIPLSALYSLASILATPWLEFRLARTLRLLPAVLVETPAATQLWQDLARKLGASPERIHCVPHPIQTSIFKPNPDLPKKNQTISVGRWESYQKNLPLLLRTLCSFLNAHPTWNSLVIGSGLFSQSPHPRIQFLPPCAPDLLARQMQESKIFFSSSRYESFGLAAAEADSCGCAVLAPTRCTLSAQTDSPLYSQDLLGRLSAMSQVSSPNPMTPVGSLPPNSLSPQTIATRILEILSSPTHAVRASG